LMRPAADFTLNEVSGKSHDGRNVSAAIKNPRWGGWELNPHVLSDRGF